MTWYGILHYSDEAHTLRSARKMDSDKSLFICKRIKVACTTLFFEAGLRVERNQVDLADGWGRKPKKFLYINPYIYGYMYTFFIVYVHCIHNNVCRHTTHTLLLAVCCYFIFSCRWVVVVWGNNVYIHSIYGTNIYKMCVPSSSSSWWSSSGSSQTKRWREREARENLNNKQRNQWYGNRKL